MANICSTTYVLRGGQEEFEKLYKLLKKLDKKKPISLGEDDAESVITYWEKGSKHLDIETKWLPNPDELRLFLNENRIHLDFSWYAQEAGCLLFEKCDTNGDFADFEWHIEQYWLEEDSPLLNCDPDLDSYTLSQILEPITGIKDIQSSVTAYNALYGMAIFPIEEVS